MMTILPERRANNITRDVSCTISIGRSPVVVLFVCVSLSVSTLAAVVAIHAAVLFVILFNFKLC